MTWRPSQLTRKQLEERRMEGGRLLSEGNLSQREIALELGVHEASVSRWKESLKCEGSEGLKARKAPGRPCRLDEQGRQQLLADLRKGAQAQGFPDERWTLPRIAEVLSKTQGISYDPDHLSVVMRRLGWSVQRPQGKAVERDEEQIQTWLETSLPEALKKGQ
jgi:putative transposase